MPSVTDALSQRDRQLIWRSTARSRARRGRAQQRSDASRRCISRIDLTSVLCCLGEARHQPHGGTRANRAYRELTAEGGASRREGHPCDITTATAAWSAARAFLRY